MGRPRKIIATIDCHIKLPERDMLELRLYLPLSPNGTIKRNELSNFFSARLREWLDKQAFEMK